MRITDAVDELESLRRRKAKLEVREGQLTTFLKEQAGAGRELIGTKFTASVVTSTVTRFVPDLIRQHIPESVWPDISEAKEQASVRLKKRILT